MGGGNLTFGLCEERVSMLVIMHCERSILDDDGDGLDTCLPIDCT